MSQRGVQREWGMGETKGEGWVRTPPAKLQTRLMPLQAYTRRVANRKMLLNFHLPLTKCFQHTRSYFSFFSVMSSLAMAFNHNRCRCSVCSLSCWPSCSRTTGTRQKTPSSRPLLFPQPIIMQKTIVLLFSSLVHSTVFRVPLALLLTIRRRAALLSAIFWYKHYKIYKSEHIARKIIK